MSLAVVTSASDSIATMTLDPATIPLPTTPTVAPDPVTPPSPQASFASLPLEIREKIYRLAISLYVT